MVTRLWCVRSSGFTQYLLVQNILPWKISSFFQTPHRPSVDELASGHLQQHDDAEDSADPRVRRGQLLVHHRHGDGDEAHGAHRTRDLQADVPCYPPGVAPAVAGDEDARSGDGGPRGDHPQTMQPVDVAVGPNHARCRGGLRLGGLRLRLAIDECRRRRRRSRRRGRRRWRRPITSPL